MGEVTAGTGASHSRLISSGLSERVWQRRATRTRQKYHAFLKSPQGGRLLSRAAKDWSRKPYQPHGKEANSDGIDLLPVAGFSKSQIPPTPRPNLLCRPAFLGTLVAIGTALRIFQYVSDTSLWFDELSIVRNLVHRSEGQLATQPLNYAQVAPVGFLLAEKAVSRGLGESDLAF